jgi:sugar phosphate isomerase/epimerase
MSTSEHWWDGPLRVLDFNYLIEADTYDFRELVRTCRELHANVVHFHPATVSGGWDEDTRYFRSRVATKTNRDILGEALPLLHEAGVRVVVYTDGHWYPKRLMDQHPDWWVLREDGSRVENLYGDNDAPGCVNSPWRDCSTR